MTYAKVMNRHGLYILSHTEQETSQRLPGNLLLLGKNVFSLTDCLRLVLAAFGKWLNGYAMTADFSTHVLTTEYML